MDKESNSGNLGGNQLLQKAQEYHFRETLPPEEYEALLDMGAELVNPGLYDSQVFVLGSYATGEKQRLIHLKDEVNNWQGGNCRAYLMDDFADGLHPVVKFRLIADYSDFILGICEHDQGGFQLELGMLLVLTGYQNRSHLLKRTYPTKVEHEKYNWMLGAGAFDLFDYQNRLREWETSSEFQIEARELLNDILG